VAFSIAGTQATAQGIRAIRESGGSAVLVGDDAEILAAQRRLAAEEGLYLEASAAITLPALERLAAAGEAGRDGPVVLIGTSTGLKDVGATAAVLPDVPVIPPDVGALDEAIGPVG
jgi:threonine synthase